MNTIKNLNKLSGIIKDDDIPKLEAGAALHKRHSNITFKILHADNIVTIRADQGKTPAGNYANLKTLVNRTIELFEKFLPLYIKIHVHPYPYNEPGPNVVNDKWINEQMLVKSIRIKDIVRDTGIEKSNISGYVSGARPLSQPVKAMFYYYFEYKSSNADIKLNK